MTWNARVGYDFGPQASNLKLGLGVKNLFDKQYFTRSSDNNSGIYVGQPRTLFMQPSSLASSSACAACMDTPSAMATARRDNELTDDIEAPPGTQEKVGRKSTANRKERKYK